MASTASTANLLLRNVSERMRAPYMTDRGDAGGDNRMTDRPPKKTRCRAWSIEKFGIEKFCKFWRTQTADKFAAVTATQRGLAMDENSKMAWSGLVLDAQGPPNLVK